MKFITQNFRPRIAYGDINSRPMKSLPSDIDMYAAGSPCPSFSPASAKPNGTKDRRGKLIFKQAEYIEQNHPKSFLLEQVSTFKTLFPKLFKAYIQRLRRAGPHGYVVSWKILVTRHHGIPQNRKRVYIAGVRKDLPKGGVQAGRYIFNASSETCRSAKMLCFQLNSSISVLLSPADADEVLTMTKMRS